MDALTHALALGGLADTIIQQWIGPVFIVAIAVFAIIFIKDKAWMKLVSFVGIAAVVGVLIFAGPWLFGDGGIFNNTAKGIAGEINTGGVGP